MIQPATKYTNVRDAARKLQAGSPKAAPTSRAARSGHVSPERAAFQVIMKGAKSLTPGDFWLWWKKEHRDGGFFNEYLRREKATTTRRYRAVARRMHGFQQNNKSEFKRVADIPVRDYFRWLREDPDFFADNKNLKSLKRDNPDVSVYV